MDTVGFITPGNVLGLPAVALPTGVSDGLPAGVQVYADLYREDLCLLAAEAIGRLVARFFARFGDTFIVRKGTISPSPPDGLQDLADAAIEVDPAALHSHGRGNRMFSAGIR